MAHFCNGAGFVVFRRVNDKVEYLLVSETMKKPKWIPPRGINRNKGYQEFAEKVMNARCGFEVDEDLEFYEGAGVSKLPDFTRQDKKDAQVIYGLAEYVNKEKEPPLGSCKEPFASYKWVGLKEATKLIKCDETREMLERFDKYILEKVL